MGKLQTVCSRANWDDWFFADMVNGKGFQITEPATVSFDGSKERALYGAQSPLYGTTYSDERSFADRWRCRCGKTQSREHEGEICPFCNDVVTKRGPDLEMTGYMTIKYGMYIINPSYFRILNSAIGKDFNDMVQIKMKVNKNGHRWIATKEDLEVEPTNPWYGVGIMGFYNHFDEIMEYYMKQPNRKKKRKMFKNLIAQKDNIFCRHIPIYSTLFRPQSLTDDTYYFQSVDKIINTMFTLVDSLNRAEPIEQDLNLQQIQVKANTLWDYNFNAINGKDGIIRDIIMGGSLNFTSRNVIVPDPTLRVNEVDLSYHTFRELFKAKIIHYLRLYKDITYAAAEEIWDKSFTFDPEVYEIMNLVLEKEDLAIVLNRNPTLNYYSMLLMNIRRIKYAGDDFCLSLNLAILEGLNADQQNPSRSGGAAMRTRASRERLTSGVCIYYLPSVVYTC